MLRGMAKAASLLEQVCQRLTRVQGSDQGEKTRGVLHALPLTMARRRVKTARQLCCRQRQEGAEGGAAPTPTPLTVGWQQPPLRKTWVQGSSGAGLDLVQVLVLLWWVGWMLVRQLLAGFCVGAAAWLTAGTLFSRLRARG